MPGLGAAGGGLCEGEDGEEGGVDLTPLPSASTFSKGEGRTSRAKVGPQSVGRGDTTHGVREGHLSAMPGCLPVERTFLKRLKTGSHSSEASEGGHSIAQPVSTRL